MKTYWNCIRVVCLCACLCHFARRSELFLALPREQGAATWPCQSPWGSIGHTRTHTHTHLRWQSSGIHTTFPSADVQNKMLTDIVNMEISITATRLLMSIGSDSHWGQASHSHKHTGRCLNDSQEECVRAYVCVCKKQLVSHFLIFRQDLAETPLSASWISISEFAELSRKNDTFIQNCSISPIRGVKWRCNCRSISWTAVRFRLEPLAAVSCATSHCQFEG